MNQEAFGEATLLQFGAVAVTSTHTVVASTTVGGGEGDALGAPADPPIDDDSMHLTQDDAPTVPLDDTVDDPTTREQDIDDMYAQPEDDLPLPLPLLDDEWGTGDDEIIPDADTPDDPDVELLGIESEEEVTAECPICGELLVAMAQLVRVPDCIGCMSRYSRGSYERRRSSDTSISALTRPPTTSRVPELPQVQLRD